MEDEANPQGSMEVLEWKIGNSSTQVVVLRLVVNGRRDVPSQVINTRANTDATPTATGCRKSKKNGESIPTLCGPRMHLATLLTGVYYRAI